MILKQLKQLTLSATRRNADVVWRARFYSSPAVCQALTTSKARKRPRLSRDDRRAVVVSFVSEYRAANAGKFPTLDVTLKEVGGSFYVVRDILQEMKLNPNAPLPIVAKALSQVPAPVPIDVDTEHIPSVAADPVCQDGSPGTIETGSDQSPGTKDFSHPNSDESDLQGNNLVIAATHDKTAIDADTEHISSVVADPVCQDGSPGTVETGSDQSPGTKDFSHPNSDESDLQGNNLVVAATHDKTATETAPKDDVDSKCVSDSNTHLPESQPPMVSEECLKNSETEEEEKLTHLGSQESKADHPEGTDVSANVLPTETSQVSEKGDDGEVKTGESSSAWSNLMSFAKEFANFWRKG